MKNFIIIHDSDSKFGTVFTLDAWHKQRGFLWTHPQSGVQVHIGYHYLVYNGKSFSSEVYDELQDGLIIPCRPEAVDGAHCFSNDNNPRNDHNKDGIGVCLIGPEFTTKQIASAIRLVGFLRQKYSIPVENIRGHKEEDPKNKSDPRLDMDSFRKMCT